MPLTKMQTAQKRTGTIEVNSGKMMKTVESFSSTTTTTRTVSQSSGKTFEDWSLSSFASPQTWVPGSKALFLTPKSPSPKLRVTRRSSIYVNKKKVGKLSSPGSGKEFKVPLPTKIKAISPVSTRTRRSSVYKKGSAGNLGVTSFQVAQEFKSKSPAGRQSTKTGKGKPKAQASTKGGRKRDMVDVEKEDSFERPAAKRRRGQEKEDSFERPAAKRRRGQPEASGSVQSPQMQKKVASKQISKSRTVKSRQGATSSRAKKATVSKNMKSPNKKKAVAHEAATPAKSTPVSARKSGTSGQSRRSTAGTEAKGESTTAANQTPGKAQSQIRKRKLTSEDLQTTPAKSARKTSAARTSKSSSKSRSAKKSTRRARKVSPVASSPALLTGYDLVDEGSTPVSSGRSSRRRNQRTAPRSSSVSKKKSVSESSTRKSASKSDSKFRSVRKSDSAKKTSKKIRSTKKTARRQLEVDSEASDEQDGSFLQASAQKMETVSPGKSKRAKSPSRSQKRSAKKSSTPKKSHSASKSGKRSHKRESWQQSAQSPSGGVAVKENIQAAAKKSSEKAQRSQKRKSISSVSVTQQGVLESVHDTLDGSYVQFAKKTSQKKIKGSKTPSKSASPLSSPIRSATKSTPKRQSPLATKQKKNPSAKRSTPSKRQSLPEKEGTPSSRATPKRESLSTKKLKSAQQSAVSSVKGLNFSPRTPASVITSTPKSIGKAKPGSLRKSLLMSLQKSTVADDSFDGNTSTLSASMRPAVARRNLGKPLVSTSQAVQSSVGTASFMQYVERRSHNTVERYSSAGLSRTEGGQTYQAGGYRVEHESSKLHESREEFGEWAHDNTNNSALSTSGAGNLSLTSSTYSSRCAIL